MEDVTFAKIPVDTLCRIVSRAADLAGSDIDRISLMMDLRAAHGVNGNPELDLDKLEAFDDFNFAHDVFGISRHMDRVRGQIMDHFLPRCVKVEELAVN